MVVDCFASHLPFITCQLLSYFQTSTFLRLLLKLLQGENTTRFDADDRLLSLRSRCNHMSFFVFSVKNNADRYTIAAISQRQKSLVCTGPNDARTTVRKVSARNTKERVSSLRKNVTFAPVEGAPGKIYRSTYCKKNYFE